MFENIIDMIIHHSYSIQVFFCSGEEELIGIVAMYWACIKVIKTSIKGEFVSIGSYSFFFV